MDINGTFNSVVTRPKDLYDFVYLTKSSLEKATTFGELEDLANSLIPNPGEEYFMQIKDPSQEGYPNDEYMMKTRIALALNVVTPTGIKVLYQRTADIAQSSDFEVKNLNTLDAIIASRVFIPGGKNYGILGKIGALRGKTSKYYDSSIKVSIDTDMMGYESEPCFMIRGTVEIQDDELLQIILEDPNVLLCTSKV